MWVLGTDAGSSGRASFCHYSTLQGRISHLFLFVCLGFPLYLRSNTRLIQSGLNWNKGKKAGRKEGRQEG